MSKTCHIEKFNNTYRVFHLGQPARTPMGNFYETVHSDLANLLCDDINELGPDPTIWPSYVSLHASYCDFGRNVEKDELISNVLNGYTREWDLALYAESWFDEVSNNPMPDSVKDGLLVDPRIYFGQPVEFVDIQSWLGGMSRRGLITAQTLAGNYQSILVSYRTLKGAPPEAIRLMAGGLVHFGKRFRAQFYMSHTGEELLQKMEAFMPKAQRYAEFPDE